MSVRQFLTRLHSFLKGLQWNFIKKWKFHVLRFRWENCEYLWNIRAIPTESRSRSKVAGKWSNVHSIVLRWFPYEVIFPAVALCSRICSPFFPPSLNTFVLCSNICFSLSHSDWTVPCVTVMAGLEAWTDEPARGRVLATFREGWMEAIKVLAPSGWLLGLAVGGAELACFFNIMDSSRSSAGRFLGFVTWFPWLITEELVLLIDLSIVDYLYLSKVDVQQSNE